VGTWITVSLPRDIRTTPPNAATRARRRHRANGILSAESDHANGANNGYRGPSDAHFTAIVLCRPFAVVWAGLMGGLIALPLAGAMAVGRRQPLREC
jgi:hypothetical protein